MDIKDVIESVEEIEANSNDPEWAHTLEDKLHASVLEYIASGKCSNPAEFASEALKTRRIAFNRWYS